MNDNNDFYNKKFLWDTLFLLQKEIQDLSMWSVYNDDIALGLIQKLQADSDLLRKKLIEMDKQGKLPIKDSDEKGGEQ